MVALPHILDFLHRALVISFNAQGEFYVPISELWILVISRYLKIRHYNVQYCDVSILLYLSPFIDLTQNPLLDTTQSSEFTRLKLRKGKKLTKISHFPKNPKILSREGNNRKTTTDAKKLRFCWKLEGKHSTQWLFGKEWLITYFKVSRGSA